MILVFGSINIDLVARVSSIPRPGETVLSPGYEMLFGGKGANQAVAAARALEGTGIRVSMAARVGDDEFGRAALANLQANGVATNLVASASQPTGCAFITVDSGGENAITVASGANMALRAADLPHQFRPEDILVLQMEVPFEEAFRVAQAAKAAGAFVIWNFAPAPASFSPEALTSLLAVTDVFVVNEGEALAAAGILGLSSSDADRAALDISRANPPAIVLTGGATGARLHSGRGEVFHAPALPVEAVDTTGAGDTFVGVLAAELSEGGDLTNAVRKACVAASLACNRPGAQGGMPRRSDLSRVT